MFWLFKKLSRFLHHPKNIIVTFVSLQRQRMEIILRLKELEWSFFFVEIQWKLNDKKKNLIFFRLIEVSTEKKNGQLLQQCATRNHAVFRPFFLVDTSKINSFIKCSLLLIQGYFCPMFFSSHLYFVNSLRVWNSPVPRSFFKESYRWRQNAWMFPCMKYYHWKKSKDALNTCIRN